MCGLPTRKLYLSLSEHALQTHYLRRELFNALRLAAAPTEALTAAIIDIPTLTSTPESGNRAGYDGEGRTGSSTADEAIKLGVVKLPEARPGIVLFRTGRVLKRSIPWAARCSRLGNNDERCATTLAGFNVIAFFGYMLKQALISIQSAYILSGVLGFVNLGEKRIFIVDEAA